jgi:hypothetical protein
MRYRTLIIAGAAVVAAGAAFIAPVMGRDHPKAAVSGHQLAHRPPTVGGSAGGRPVPRRTPIAQPLLGPHPVHVDGTVFFGWSLLNRHTGEIVGSGNRDSGTNSTESMIKAWIASDYLRRLGNSRPSAGALHDLTLMIIDSNDRMAQRYYAMDGHNSVVARLIQTCGLKDTRIYNAWWSKTRMSPADAVRYGRCVADGRAAGKKWTPWILDTMTHVRGSVTYQQATTGGGHWGIIDALPADVVRTTSIKNGWTSYDGVWHVNCMAIQADWVLSVMSRYPSAKGLKFGAGICASVAAQLTNPPPPTHNGATAAVS